MGMAIAGIVVFSLYAGINFGMFNLQMSRENLRATQIMLEKVETLRFATGTS